MFAGQPTPALCKPPQARRRESHSPGLPCPTPGLSPLHPSVTTTAPPPPQAEAVQRRRSQHLPAEASRSPAHRRTVADARQALTPAPVTRRSGTASPRGTARESDEHRATALVNDQLRRRRGRGLHRGRIRLAPSPDRGPPGRGNPRRGTHIVDFRVPVSRDVKAFKGCWKRTEYPPNPPGALVTRTGEVRQLSWICTRLRGICSPHQTSDSDGPRRDSNPKTGA